MIAKDGICSSGTNTIVIKAKSKLMIDLDHVFSVGTPVNNDFFLPQIIKYYGSHI